MDLKSYWSSLNPDEKDEFCRESDCDRNYMSQIVGGSRNPSPKLARRMRVASGGKLTLAKLRPDIWGDAAA